MPIDYRKNLSYKSKCPADINQRLRDPKCRSEMKDKIFEPVKPPSPTPGPSPTPPTPGPGPPKPPKPGPPQPNPKPDFNAPRPIPYHTSSSMPVSAIGMATGGVAAGALFGASQTAKIGNLTRGYRQLSTTETAAEDTPVEEMKFADGAETEMTDITPKIPENLKSTSIDGEFFKQGESLEEGADVAEESGTVAENTAANTDLFRASGEVDFQPDFNDASSGMEADITENLATETTAEVGEEGGIEMADLGASALTTGGEVAGEVGTELATEAATAGEVTAGSGGAGAIISVGIMAVGLGVAVGQLIGGAILAHDKYLNNEFNKMDDTQKITKEQLQGMVRTLSGKQSNAKSQKEIDAIQKQINQVQGAIDNNQTAVTYKDSKGNQQLAFSLTNGELAKAIKTYQVNPDAFKGLDSTQLEIMGLNPNMSKGASGAKGLAKNGINIPSGSYDGKNIANNYLASNRQNAIVGQKGINEGFSKAILPQEQKAYETQMETAIDNASNANSKQQLITQYSAWRASVGMTTYQDEMKIRALNKQYLSGSMLEKAMGASAYDAKVAAIEKNVKTDELQAGQTLGQEKAVGRALQENQETTINKTISETKDALSGETKASAGVSKIQNTGTTQTSTLVSSLQTTIDGLNTKMSSIQNTINGYKSRGQTVPSALTGAISNIQNIVNGVKARQLSITSSNTTLQNKLSTSQTNIAQVKATTNTNLATAQSNLNTVKNANAAVVGKRYLATTGNTTPAPAPAPVTTTPAK